MASLQIKNVPDEMHIELRRRAGQRGITVRDYMLDLLRSDQRLPSKQDWLAGVAKLESGVEREQILEALHAGRRA
jgi:plasmid stability protein